MRKKTGKVLRKMSNTMWKRKKRENAEESAKVKR